MGGEKVPASALIEGNAGGQGRGWTQYTALGLDTRQSLMDYPPQHTSEQLGVEGSGLVPRVQQFSSIGPVAEPMVDGGGDRGTDCLSS